jgi:hypothetical protein
VREIETYNVCQVELATTTEYCIWLLRSKLFFDVLPVVLVELATEQEFAHDKETSADSSRRNPAGGISRSAQADTLRGCSRAARAAHPDRTHCTRRKIVTADAALRLGKFFKTGAAFWMNIQARFVLETAEDVLAPQIKKIASYPAQNPLPYA